MTPIMLGSVLISGAAGLCTGYWVPEAGEKLMAYKAAKKNREYPVFGNRPWSRWLYVGGVFAAWTSSALIPSAFEGLLFAALSYLLFVVTYLDNRYRIIPNECIVMILVIGVGESLAAGGIIGAAGSVLAMMAGVFICFAAALLTRGKHVVGAGDVKLMAVCCFFAGMPGFINSLLFMSLAMVVYCVGGLMTGYLKLDSYFPMGGFIAMGLVLSLYPDQLLMALKLI